METGCVLFYYDKEYLYALDGVDCIDRSTNYDSLENAYH